jgi:SAM-dependent methyltransferase
MPIREMWRGIRRYYSHLKDSRRSTKEVFTEIYMENLWGDGRRHTDNDFPFDSGPGSSESAVGPYAEFIKRFIESHHVKSVLDLGCGDFRTGSRIVQPSFRYTGIDIVEPLIQANQAKFGKDNVQFLCLDIITDDLPDADLCLVREVLQHLSNAQIIQILQKLKKFKWVIVTEDMPGPLGSFKANRDKPHGQHARVVSKSGIVLTEQPFNVPAVELLLEVPALRSEHGRGERIATFLVSNVAYVNGEQDRRTPSS